MSITVHADHNSSAAGPAPTRPQLQPMAVVPAITRLSRASSYELVRHPDFRHCFTRIGRALRVDVEKLTAVLESGGSAAPIRPRTRRGR